MSATTTDMASLLEAQRAKLRTPPLAPAADAADAAATAAATPAAAAPPTGVSGSPPPRVTMSLTSPPQGDGVGDNSTGTAGGGGGSATGEQSAPPAPHPQRESETPSVTPEPIPLCRMDDATLGAASPPPPPASAAKRPREEGGDEAGGAVPPAKALRKGSAHVVEARGQGGATYADRASVPAGTTTHNRAALPHDVRACRRVESFKRLNEIAEGTFGKLWRARDTASGEVMALKQVKMEVGQEGFPLTALREIYLLMSLEHPNIVGIKEVVVGTHIDSVFLVMEYVEHDLKCIMDQEGLRYRWTLPEMKSLLKQLLRAVAFMHKHWVLHRDLKTSNLLYANNGVLKVCDFGLARLVGDQNASLTPGTCTLWYRSPEVLMEARNYTAASDVWGVGCIGAELVLGSAMLRGKTEADQLNLLFGTFGVPNERDWPGYTALPLVKKGMAFNGPPASRFPNFFRTAEAPVDADPASARKTFLPASGVEVLQGMLALNPARRLAAGEALKHPFFTEAPLPQSAALMPSFPATNDVPRKKLKAEMRERYQVEAQQQQQQPAGGAGAR